MATYKYLTSKYFKKIAFGGISVDNQQLTYCKRAIFTVQYYSNDAGIALSARMISCNCNELL